MDRAKDVESEMKKSETIDKIRDNTVIFANVVIRHMMELDKLSIESKGDVVIETLKLLTNTYKVDTLSKVVRLFTDLVNKVDGDTDKFAVQSTQILIGLIDTVEKLEKNIAKTTERLQNLIELLKPEKEK